MGFNNFIANFKKRDLRVFIPLRGYDLVDYFMPSSGFSISVYQVINKFCRCIVSLRL